MKIVKGKFCTECEEEKESYEAEGMEHPLCLDCLIKYYISNTELLQILDNLAGNDLQHGTAERVDKALSWK